jgi:hypothetical protein
MLQKVKTRGNINILMSPVEKLEDGQLGSTALNMSFGSFLD